MISARKCRKLVQNISISRRKELIEDFNKCLAEVNEMITEAARSGLTDVTIRVPSLISQDISSKLRKLGFLVTELHTVEASKITMIVAW